MAEKSPNKKETLVLLDSHAVLHRAYHALPASFTAPDGMQTNALYGFSAFLIRILKELKPDFVVATYDLPEPTFRKVAFKEYKSQRKKMDDALALQINKSKEILAAFKIPIFEFPGFEADDVLGTITENIAKEKNLKTIIASGDLDTLQLVKGNSIVVYTLKKGINDTTVYNEESVKQRFGFEPRLIPDYKGLCGDQSDNIPGVKGIGEKTAAELLQKFGGMDEVYKNLEEDGAALLKAGFKKRICDLLNEQKDRAYMSRALAVIRRDAPIEFSLNSLKQNGKPRKEEITEIFEKLGFKSLIPRLDEAGYFFNSDKNYVMSVAGHAAKSFDDFKKSAAKEKEVFWIYELASLRLARTTAVKSALSMGKNGKNTTPKVFAVVTNGKFFEIKKEDVARQSEFLNKIFKTKKNYGFKSKELYKFFDGSGVEPNFSFDLGLAAWLINSRLANPALSEIYREYGEEFYSGVNGSTVYEKIFDVKNKVLERLKDEELSEPFQKIEMPLLKVLLCVERRGVFIDKTCFSKLSEFCAKELECLEQKIWRAAHENFNINSTKELRRVLFEKLGIEEKGIKKTEGGVRSTKFSELVKLKNKHPVIENLISYRELAKLKSTYTDTLPTLVGKDGRVHTTFNQTGTVTGRLSSSEPNLQNIPVKSELGRKIRGCFVADMGYKLVSFDYSQIELRVAALISNDKKMIQAFREGKDIHATTASEIFNTPLSEVTQDMRRKAKVINFGILYGMGAYAISESLGISKKEAEEYRYEYFKDFAGVAEYIADVIEEARTNGFVKTLFGRKRRFDEIYSANGVEARGTERMAVNMPIQGTSADIIKIAMVKIHEFLEKNNLENKAKMLLQIHDELLFEIKDEFLDEAVEIIKNIMEEVMKPYSSEIPFPVEVSVGNAWGK